jgi:hypothetical protein
MDIQTEINTLIEAFRNETEAGENFFRLSDILEKLNRAKTDGLEEKEITFKGNTLVGEGELYVQLAQEKETVQIIGIQYKVIPGTIGIDDGSITVSSKNTRDEGSSILGSILQGLGLTLEPETQSVLGIAASIGDTYGKVILSGNVVHKVGSTITITSEDEEADNTGTFEVDEVCYCDGVTKITVKALLLEGENVGLTVEFNGYVPEDQLNVYKLLEDETANYFLPVTGINFNYSIHEAGSEDMQVIIKVKYTKYTW